MSEASREGAPIAGRCVAVTRSEDAAGDLCRRLEEAGARVLSIPAIRHLGIADRAPLRAALERAATATHLVFTSPQAVRFFLEEAAKEGWETGRWRSIQVAAVGEGTAAALETYGLRAEVTSRGQGAEALARALIDVDRVGRGSRVILPQSAIARPELRQALEAAGAAVDAIDVYQTLSGDPSRARPFLDALDAGTPPDAITFSSPSTIRGFLDMTGDRGRAALAGGLVRIVSIGPTTSAAIRGEGLEVAAEARSPGPRALTEAVIATLRA
jgi:uroporphyrinogen-III synthase